MRKIILLASLAVAWVAFFAALTPAQSAPVTAGSSVPANLSFFVTDTADVADSNIGDGTCISTDGKCTLRAAIQEANYQYAQHGGYYTISVKGGLTINSPPLLYALTIPGSGEDDAATGDLDIKSNLYIGTNGLSARVSAAGISDRVFHVIQPLSHTISVTFANIWMTNGSNVDRGGGLLVDSAASVTLSGLRVMTNTAGGQFAEGGGIDFRGDGRYSMNGVEVRNNHAKGGNNGAVSGGGVYSFGDLSVNTSTIVSNVISSNSPVDNISGIGGGISVVAGGTLVISGSSVLGNSINLGSNAQFVTGGGINVAGNVTLTHSTVDNNMLNVSGSNVTVVEGGGMYVNGRLLMLTSTVAGNSVLSGVPSLSMHGGGLSFNFHTQIISSTISSNVVRAGVDPAGYGGGISVGGFYYNADLLLDRSVVESNVADDGGGINTDITTTTAIRNSAIYYNLAKNGAGIFNLGVLSVTNDTFYVNSAANSGGALYNSQTANVDSSTFYGNVADYDDVGGVNGGDGGAIFVPGSATQYLRNSLLTGNEDRTTTGGGASLPDCGGIVISQDYNLIQQAASPAGCNLIGSTGHDRHGTFANVLDTTLQDNGGPTPTQLLPAGSIAIDGGDPAGCKDENGSALLIDQRLHPRLGHCDIGAYEFARLVLLPLVVR